MSGTRYTIPNVDLDFFRFYRNCFLVYKGTNEPVKMQFFLFWIVFASNIFVQYIYLYMLLSIIESFQVVNLSSCVHINKWAPKSSFEFKMHRLKQMDVSYII